MEYDVFISYSREDLSVVEPLVKDIEQKAGVKCWIDWNGIETGTQFEEVIIKAIDSVDIVIFFISENSISSQYARMEVNYAYNTKKKVVPIVLDGGDLRGWFLFKFGSIDYIDINKKRQYDKLIQNLQSWCGTMKSLYSQKLAIQPETIGKELLEKTIKDNITNGLSNTQGWLQTIFHFQERHWLINLVCIISLIRASFSIVLHIQSIVLVMQHNSRLLFTVDLLGLNLMYVITMIIGYTGYKILLNSRDAVYYIICAILILLVGLIVITMMDLWSYSDHLGVNIVVLALLIVTLWLRKKDKSGWFLIRSSMKKKFQIGFWVYYTIVWIILGVIVLIDKL